MDDLDLHLQRLSIPSVVDGLTLEQRKILFCAFKRNLVKEVKVLQFCDYVAQQSAYWHRKESLAHTLVGMAQDFVGTNNINLMYPGGNFGTRYQGEENSWETQYIFTKLSPITRSIFPEDDDVPLNYLQIYGKSIEPTWYMPILPMVLVNGIDVSGNGWSTYVPKYNPRDIIANLRRLLNDKSTETMHPWYRSFKGSIEKTRKKAVGVTYTTTGIIEAVDRTMLRITELPICCWTRDYKEFLQSLAPDDKIKCKETTIEEYSLRSDGDDVYIDIILSEEDMVIAKQEGLEKKFKLTTTIGPINMHLFDPNGNIRKYDTPEQILEEFFKFRLEFYEKRKEALLEKIKLGLKKLNNKVRFICCIVDDDIIVSKRKKAELLLELQQKNFDPLPEKNEESPEAAKELNESDYEYLLSMPIGTLTWEKIQELIDEKNKLENELEKLTQTSPRALWLSDLNAFEKELDVLDRMDAEAVEERRAMMEMHAQTAATRRAGPKRRPKRTKARTQNVEPDTRETTEPVLAKRAAPRKKEPTKKARASTLVGGDEENDMPRLKDRLAAFSINNFSPEDSENATEPVVAKHTVPRKKPTKKASARVSGDDEDMPTLKNRLVAFSLIDSFPSHSAMESEITEEQQKGKKVRKAPSQRGTANKAPSSLGVLPDDDEVQDDNFFNEEASELQNEKAADMGQLRSDQPKCTPAGRPKRSRKPTWKIQDQMEAKGAARPSNAICRASGALQFFTDPAYYWICWASGISNEYNFEEQ